MSILNQPVWCYATQIEKIYYGDPLSEYYSGLIAAVGTSKARILIDGNGEETKVALLGIQKTGEGTVRLVAFKEPAKIIPGSQYHEPESTGPHVYSELSKLHAYYPGLQIDLGNPVAEKEFQEMDLRKAAVAWMKSTGVPLHPGYQQIAAQNTPVLDIETNGGKAVISFGSGSKEVNCLEVDASVLQKLFLRYLLYVGDLGLEESAWKSLIGGYRDVLAVTPVVPCLAVKGDMWLRHGHLPEQKQTVHIVDRVLAQSNHSLIYGTRCGQKAATFTEVDRRESPASNYTLCPRCGNEADHNEIMAERIKVWRIGQLRAQEMYDQCTRHEMWARLGRQIEQWIREDALAEEEPISIQPSVLAELLIPQR